jgi:hypothetical protein
MALAVFAYGQLTASIAMKSTADPAAVTNAMPLCVGLTASPLIWWRVRQALDAIIKDGIRAGDVIGRIRAHIKMVLPRHDQLDINEAILEVIEVTRSELLRNGVSLQTELAKACRSFEAIASSCNRSSST